MGHYEREIVDYNPVTDRNYYGEKKYVEDENDKREAYERRRREDQSDDIKTYIDNIKSSSDFNAISKAEDAIEISTDEFIDPRMGGEAVYQAVRKALEKKNLI